MFPPPVLKERSVWNFNSRRNIKLGKVPPRGQITSWRLHIDTFWILPPISFSKRLEVELMGWLLKTVDLLSKY
jgi:hypothetical protein